MGCGGEAHTHAGETDIPRTAERGACACRDSAVETGIPPARLVFAAKLLTHTLPASGCPVLSFLQPLNPSSENSPVSFTPPDYSRDGAEAAEDPALLPASL